MTQKTLRKLIFYILTTNYSNRRISDLLGCHHETVRKKRALTQKLSIDIDKLNELDDAQLAKLFYKSRGKSKGFRKPDFEYMRVELQKKGVTKMLLWHEYCLEDPKTAYSYSQFTHEYRKYLKRIDVTLIQSHIAGESTQVDFAGKTIPYTEGKARQDLKAHVFIGILPSSNLTFVWACRSQKLADFIDAHVRMFTYFGGSTATLTPDNLKSAVIKAGKIPQINPTYDDMARHFSTVIIPARPKKPKDKAAVENAVLIVTRWILARLRHRQFFSLEEINDAIAPLLEELNNRPFKNLPGSRRSQFEAFEKGLLQPLPETPFEYGEWVNRLKVGPDYHIQIDGHAYSVPYTLVSEYVDTRKTAHGIEIFHLSKRVALHKRSFTPGQSTTNSNHRPAHHQAYAERNEDEFVSWASSIGHAATEVVKAQFHGKPAYSMVGAKACDQLKALAKQYGEDRFEAACAYACELHSKVVKTVKSVLQSKADLVMDIPTETALPQHQNIRGAHYYAGGAA